MHGCDLLRIAHRLSMESIGRHEVLPWFHGARSLPRMGRSRGLRTDVGGRPARLRRDGRDRLVLDEHGRLHDQGPARGGTRQAEIPPIAPSPGATAATWSTATG